MACWLPVYLPGGAYIQLFLGGGGVEAHADPSSFLYNYV